MTRDEIIKLVEDNGLTLHGDIEHFAELVAQHEREACAKVCDHMAVRYEDMRGAALESAAESIRLRGKA
jgi:hypothetical protein